ncbi:MAG: cysteine desulfurase NifS [Clostridia bacterium]|nr:cysteine desulfurase NifS [Clostridia bacterium]
MKYKMIYFDNAATTGVSKEVLDAMLPYFTENYGNPSSVYAFSDTPKEAIAESRRRIAKCLNCDASEIFFTASGSEADNWAIKGVCDAAAKNGKNKIITSAIEHHAVLTTCEYMEKHGFEVTYLPVDETGLVNPSDLENAIDGQTALVSIMYANNEIGTIEPIKELVEIAHKYKVPFHTDAVQAAGTIKIDIKDLGVDLLSISGHKFHAPKGIGALYIKKGTKITSFIHGGMQERGKRAGTENVPYIVGIATALENACANLDNYTKKVTALRDKLIKGVMEAIPYVKLNGHTAQRLPGNANFSFKYIEGESLLLWLDMNGIAASSGSACTSGSLDPSHVLLAIGLPHEIAHGSLRISLSYENTEEEIDKLLEVLPQIVDRLRNMSPLYEEVLK